LIELHTLLREMLNNRIGNRLTSRDIVDLMNMIGKCVIAGNIRRVAEIALGESNDSNFIALKDYT
jgi:ribonucleoside-triphosphate reductase